MIVYVSPAETNGGILQFSITMLERTLSFTDCLLFLPDSVDIGVYGTLGKNIVLYKKIKTVNSHNIEIKKLSEMIAAKIPNKIVFLEDSLLMQQLNKILRNKFRSAIVVHDVIQHPYRNMGMRKMVVEALRRLWMKKTVSKDNRIILLSDNSKTYFANLYKRCRAKTLCMRLGAHVPEATPEMPLPLSEIDAEYYLFFGRIDKYKGIENLCAAYERLPEDFIDKYHLVIAGKGQFSSQEIAYIKADNRIHILNRFITDGEMNWLFKNSVAVVMPYIEASQSGVLPIAYHFSKPVIVTDQPGLTENVIDGKTGYIAHSVEEMSEKLQNISGKEYEQMINNIRKYYKKRFTWEENIQLMLKKLES